MKKFVHALFIACSILPIQSIYAQDLTEKTNNEYGYSIQTFTENFELKNISEFVNDELMRSISFNPKTGFQQGECYDGLNTLVFDEMGIATSVYPNVLIDVTEEYKNRYEIFKDHYSYEEGATIYTEILIHNLSLENGKHSGKAHIVAYTYKKIDDRHPYFSFPLVRYCLNQLTQKAPYLTISHHLELEPLSVETIGMFELENNKYNGEAELHLPGFDVKAILQFDSPIKFETTFTDEKTGQQIRSSFQCGQSTYMHQNQLFKSPSIDKERHSFALFKEKRDSKDLGLERFSHYPFINFDFISGKLSLENYDISVERSADALTEEIFELVYYDSTGTYYTATLNGQLHRFFGSDAVTTIEPLERFQLPIYYYKINHPDWIYFSNVEKSYKLRFDPKNIIESNVDSWTRKYHRMNEYGDPSWNCDWLKEQQKPLSKREVLVYLNNKINYLRTSNGVTETIHIEPNYIIYNFHYSITYNWSSIGYSDHHFQSYGLQKKSEINSNLECYGLESQHFEQMAQMENESSLRVWEEADYLFMATVWIQSGQPKYLNQKE